MQESDNTVTIENYVLPIHLKAGNRYLIIIRDKLVCLRLHGMFFQLNKTFLLPSAISGIKKLVRIYQKNKGGNLLVVGHTDRSGDTTYNDALSLERAESVIQYLKDEVDEWLKYYSTSYHEKKRWDENTDLLMIRSLSDSPQDLNDTDTVIWFQTKFKDKYDLGEKPVDGIIGPKTRRAIISEYMAHDSTTLPKEINAVSHGCGESFPETMEVAESEYADADRRVEIFIFPHEILPPPEGKFSRPDSTDYPAWKSKITQHIDLGIDGDPVQINFVDATGSPVSSKKAYLKLPDLTESTFVSDENGLITIENVIDGVIKLAVVPFSECENEQPATLNSGGTIELKNTNCSEFEKDSNITIVCPNDCLENVLFTSFLSLFENLISTYRPQIEKALRQIYGFQIKDPVLKEFLDSEEKRKLLKPESVFCVSKESLNGATGCYMASRKWIFLRDDYAEKLWEEKSINFKRAELTVEISEFLNENQEKPSTFFPQSPVNTLDLLLNTYIEEMGHHLDLYIQFQNHRDYFDTPGDEGELFNILMFKGEERLSAGDDVFTQTELDHAQREDDMASCTVKIGAEIFENEIVEFQNSYGTTQMPKATVSYIQIYLTSNAAEEALNGQAGVLDIHAPEKIYRYTLAETSGLTAGEYGATVEIDPPGSTLDVKFTFIQTADGQHPNFTFDFLIQPGNPNPKTLLANQPFVIFLISRDAPPVPVSRDKTSHRPAGVTYLSALEALELCNANALPGIKIFPWRGTRFGGAPVFAHRDGNDIVARQPVYVLANTDFHKQTKTLVAHGVFSGGCRMNPNEIVRIHIYEPHWYHLNITGDATSDKQTEFCIRAEDLLYYQKASENATLMNIGLTVVDAATFFIPIGAIASKIGSRVINFTGSNARAILMASMLGMRDAVPTAFGGIASRTATVLVENQSTTMVTRTAATTTFEHMAIQFSGRRSLEVVVSSGLPVGQRLLGETAKITIVDTAGSAIVHTLTAPTGDAALDRLLDQAFYNVAPTPPPPIVPGQGLVTIAPEVAAGFTQAQINAFRVFISKSFANNDMTLLNQLWNNAARPGDSAILNAANSRYLFNLHRNRFWTLVRNNPTARKLFEDAGCQFESGAPFFRLNGNNFTLNLDHIIERQTAPELALTAANLRIIFPRENSVILRLINAMDPFQAVP